MKPVKPLLAAALIGSLIQLPSALAQSTGSNSTTRLVVRSLGVESATATSGINDGVVGGATVTWQRFRVHAADGNHRAYLIREVTRGVSLLAEATSSGTHVLVLSGNRVVGARDIDFRMAAAASGCDDVTGVVKGVGDGCENSGYGEACLPVILAGGVIDIGCAVTDAMHYQDGLTVDGSVNCYNSSDKCTFGGHLTCGEHMHCSYSTVMTVCYTTPQREAQNQGCLAAHQHSIQICPSNAYGSCDGVQYAWEFGDTSAYLAATLIVLDTGYAQPDREWSATKCADNNPAAVGYAGCEAANNKGWRATPYK